MFRTLVILVASAMIATPAAAGPQPARSCAGTALGTGTVAGVSGDTLRLADGRSVRLDGIVVAREPGSADTLQAPAAAMLAGFIGRKVTLTGRDGTDRYGRLRAYVTLADAQPAVSLQRQLLEQGLARVSVREAAPGCAAALLAREQQARDLGLGIWNARDYAIVHADDPAVVLGMRGRFALVEGRVLSVRRSGGTIYVNFGRRWSEDFTVTIAKRLERMFVAAGMAPKSLAHRTVRIRGIVEERGGPWIEVARPEQIALVKD
jgi:endonuclease YncB( thermonuclease family)